MTNPPDDLEAVRTLITTLEHFAKPEQERIIRWAMEKLGVAFTSAQGAMPTGLQSSGTPAGAPAAAFTASAAISSRPELGKDIKSFILEKKPTSDSQFAATVAYYHKFEAPEIHRKDFIKAEDLQDACRKAGRDRLHIPGQTLRNAHRDGLLDKAGEAGSFSINTVGENLVAMALPGDGVAKGKKSRPSAKKAKATKKSSK